MTKKILGVVIIAFFMAAFVLFAEDAPQAPSPDAKADNFLLAADFQNAFAEYKKLLLENVNSPLADYYLAKCASVMGESGGTINREQLLDIEKTNPENAILAANLMSLKIGLLLKQGRVPDAERVADEMGFVKDWLIIGPFDNATKAGYKKVFPPETEFDTDKTYEGKNGKNTWRQLSVRPPFGTIDFSGLFRADSYVAAYAAVFIRAEKEQPIAFRTGSSGPLKIWLNDRLIAGIEAYRECGFDQDCAAGRLKPGWNKLLVKICQKDGEWKSALRITAPDGSPIKGILVQNNIDFIKKEILPAYTPDDADAQIDADSGAVGYFGKLIENNPDDHFALAGLAFMYDFKRSLDENDKTVSNNARKALEKNPGNDFYKYLVGIGDEDRNKRLEALLQLSEKNPPSAMAFFKLSELYSSTGGGNSGRRRAVSANEAEDITKTFSIPMPFREEEFLNAALKQNPDFIRASLALVRIYMRRGTPWNLEVEKISKRLLTLAPSNTEVISLTYDDDLHTTAENTSHYAGLLAADYTDGNARNYYMYNLKQAGRKDEVLKEYRAFLQLNPFASSIYQRMANYYEGFDEYKESIACLNKALETNPEDISAFEELGNYYLILNDIPKAQESWEKALAVKPNLPDITEHLEALKPKERKFWEGIAGNPAVYAAEALADTEAPLHASAVNYLKNEIIKINPNGTSSTFSQQVIKVFDEKGVNEHKYVSIDADSSEYYASSKYKVISAKLYKKDGSILEGDRYEESGNISFENLEPGDVIAIEGRVDEQGEPRYKGYYGGIVPLQKDYDPVKISKITILSPPEKKLYFAADKFAAEPKEFEKNGLIGHTWEVNNLPQIDPESLMPGFYETVPYLQVSTFETWDETARWVADLVSEQFESSPAIKQAVLDTVKGLDSQEEKINALYQKMVSDIRYEALSLDSHAYKPFKASETFDRKYGDCKDTACLFVTMLREAGIEAGFALVRVRDSGKVNTKVPSMKIFNHAITYVPDKNGGGMFYDGTARYCGAEEKPFMDEGALAFIVDRNGKGRLVEEIPFSSPADNVDENTLEITLNSDGSATVMLESKITGKEAGDFRNTYQEGANRQRYFEQMMNRYFGTITVKTLEFSDLSEYNKPVLIKAEFTTPNFARIDGPKILFTPAVFSLDLADKYASLEKREYDIVLDSYPIAYPKKSIHSMTFNIPAGYELSKLPEESQFQSDFGQYKLVTDRVAPTKFIVKTEFIVNLLRINNKQYPAFRTFCADVDRIEKEDAVIEKP